MPAALQPPLQAALEGGPVVVRALAADAAATTHAATRVQAGRQAAPRPPLLGRVVRGEAAQGDASSRDLQGSAQPRMSPARQIAPMRTTFLSRAGIARDVLSQRRKLLCYVSRLNKLVG